MARRAGVVPFSLNPEPSAPGSRAPPNPPGPRGPGHAHSHSHGSASSYAGPPPSGYGSPHAQHQHQQVQQRNVHTRSTAGVQGPTRSIAARRDSTPRSVPPSSHVESLTLAGIRSPMMGPLGGHGGGNGNGNGNGHGRGAPGQMLPSVLEMTTRVSPYSIPAYSVSSSAGGGYSSPGPLLPAMGYRESGSGRALPSVPEGPGHRSGSEEAGVGREGLRRGRGGYE